MDGMYPLDLYQNPRSAIVPDNASGMRRRFIEAAIIFAVFVFIPAILIENLIGQYEDEREKILERTYQDRARDLIVRLNTGIDRLTLIEERLQVFRKRAETLLHGDKLDAENSRSLTIFSRKQFPRDTLFLCLDDKGNLLQPRGLAAPFKRKAWEALFGLLRKPRGMNSDQISHANNLIKSAMGDIIEPHFLRQSFKRPLNILREGNAQAMRILTLHSSGNPRNPGAELGHLILFIPTGRARFALELESIVKRLSDANAEVGGYWQSRQEGRGTDLLTDNFMHGLLLMLENGQGFYSFQGMTCLARFWSQDPDLVLIAAVRHTSLAARQSERIVKAIRWLVQAGAIVAGLLLLAFVLGSLRLNFSLKAKFRLAAFFLAGFPCLAMVVWGVSHLLNVAEFRQNETGKRLEGLLSNVEQYVASEISRTQKKLQAVNDLKEIRQVSKESELRSIFREFEEKGLYEVVYGRQGENAISIMSRTLKPRNTFQGPRFGTMMNKLFQTGGINLLETAQNSASEIDSFLDVGSENRFPFDRLNLVCFAGDSGFYFVSFFKDRFGKAQGAFGVVLEFQKFCKLALANWLREEKPRNCRVFLRSSTSRGIHAVPRNRFLKNVVDLIEKTRERIFKPVEIGGRKYMILGRPLAALETVALAVIPFEEFSGLYPATIRFMAIFGFLATLSLIFFSDLLVFIFLRPILGIGALIRKVEEGRYEARSPIWATEELGTLASCFNRMVEGLHQKARMLPFLNRDLLEKSQVSSEVLIEPRHVAVSFAGIRDFSELEKRLSPEETMALMSEFLGKCEIWVRRWGGEIDKFLGDSAMAVFWEGGTDPSEERAVRAAIDLRRDMASWALKRKNAGLLEIRFGVGITVGNVIGGHIGSLRKRLDFTVIGDTVNLAARLEKLASRDGNPSILAASEVFGKPLKGIRTRLTSIQNVRGRAGAISVYEVEPDGN